MKVLVKVLVKSLELLMLLLAAGCGWCLRLCGGGGESCGTFRLSCGSDPAHPVEREEERRKSGQEGGGGGSGGEDGEAGEEGNIGRVGEESKKKNK